MANYCICDPSVTIDCAGICGGTSYTDACGDCVSTGGYCADNPQVQVAEGQCCPGVQFTSTYQCLHPDNENINQDCNGCYNDPVYVYDQCGVCRNDSQQTELQCNNLCPDTLCEKPYTNHATVGCNDEPYGDYTTDYLDTETVDTGMGCNVCTPFSAPIYIDCRDVAGGGCGGTYDYNLCDNCAPYDDDSSECTGCLDENACNDDMQVNGSPCQNNECTEDGGNCEYTSCCGDEDGDGTWDGTDCTCSAGLCINSGGFPAITFGTGQNICLYDIDLCGVCNGNNSANTGTCGCDGVPSSNNTKAGEVDSCGVCGGDAQTIGGWDGTDCYNSESQYYGTCNSIDCSGSCRPGTPVGDAEGATSDSESFVNSCNSCNTNSTNGQEYIYNDNSDEAYILGGVGTDTNGYLVNIGADCEGTCGGLVELNDCGICGDGYAGGTYRNDYGLISHWELFDLTDSVGDNDLNFENNGNVGEFITNEFSGYYYQENHRLYLNSLTLPNVDNNIRGVSYWFKSDTPTHTHVALGINNEPNDNQFNIGIQGSGFQFKWTQGSETNYTWSKGISAAGIDDGNWHNMVVSINSLTNDGSDASIRNMIHLWVDGVFTEWGTVPSPLPTTLNHLPYSAIDLGAGAGQGQGGDYNGFLDDVRIYSEPLTQTIVNDNWNGGVGRVRVNWNEEGVDCNGDCWGNAYHDDCGICVGGNTGRNANDLSTCTTGIDGNWDTFDNFDCNCECFYPTGQEGLNGGIDYSQIEPLNLLDQCEVCNSDASDDCTQDCAGYWGGDAEYDECGNCVCSINGNYSENPLPGNSGQASTCDLRTAYNSSDPRPCVRDCAGTYPDEGGWGAYQDPNCNSSIAGECTHPLTGFENLYGIEHDVLDNCCVGGNSSNTICSQDCSGIYNGSSYVDECGDCVAAGGTCWDGIVVSVGECCNDFENCVLNPCPQDCSGTWGGSAYEDPNCNLTTCVHPVTGYEVQAGVTEGCCVGDNAALPCFMMCDGAFDGFGGCSWEYDGLNCLDINIDTNWGTESRVNYCYVCETDSDVGEWDVQIDNWCHKLAVANLVIGTEHDELNYEGTFEVHLANIGPIGNFQIEFGSDNGDGNQGNGDWPYGAEIISIDSDISDLAFSTRTIGRDAFSEVYIPRYLENYHDEEEWWNEDTLLATITFKYPKTTDDFRIDYTKIDSCTDSCPTRFFSHQNYPYVHGTNGIKYFKPLYDFVGCMDDYSNECYAPTISHGGFCNCYWDATIWNYPNPNECYTIHNQDDCDYSYTNLSITNLVDKTKSEVQTMNSNGEFFNPLNWTFDIVGERYVDKSNYSVQWSNSNIPNDHPIKVETYKDDVLILTQKPLISAGVLEIFNDEYWIGNPFGNIISGNYKVVISWPADYDNNPWGYPNSSEVTSLFPNENPARISDDLEFTIQLDGCSEPLSTIEDPNGCNPSTYTTYNEYAENSCTYDINNFDCGYDNCCCQYVGNPSSGTYIDNICCYENETNHGNSNKADGCGVCPTQPNFDDTGLGGNYIKWYQDLEGGTGDNIVCNEPLQEICAWEGSPGAGWVDCTNNSCVFEYGTACECPAPLLVQDGCISDTVGYCVPGCNIPSDCLSFLNDFSYNYDTDEARCITDIDEWKSLVGEIQGQQDWDFNRGSFAGFCTREDTCGLCPNIDNGIVNLDVGVMEIFAGYINSDCTNTCYGADGFGAYYDTCGTCSGGNSGHVADTALDNCGDCRKGPTCVNSMLPPCDCEGVECGWNGSEYTCCDENFDINCLSCDGTTIINDESEWLTPSTANMNELGFGGYLHLYDACGICGGNSVGVCVSDDSDNGKYCVPSNTDLIPNILDYGNYIEQTNCDTGTCIVYSNLENSDCGGTCLVSGGSLIIDSVLETEWNADSINAEGCCLPSDMKFFFPDLDLTFSYRCEGNEEVQCDCEVETVGSPPSSCVDDTICGQYGGTCILGNNGERGACINISSDDYFDTAGNPILYGQALTNISTEGDCVDDGIEWINTHTNFQLCQNRSQGFAWDGIMYGGNYGGTSLEQQTPQPGHMGVCGNGDICVVGYGIDGFEHVEQCIDGSNCIPNYLNYYTFTDTCFGYFDQCDDCWSFEDSDLYGSRVDCNGICSNEGNLADECNCNYIETLFPGQCLLPECGYRVYQCNTQDSTHGYCNDGLECDPNNNTCASGECQLGYFKPDCSLPSLSESNCPGECNEISGTPLTSPLVGGYYEIDYSINYSCNSFPNHLQQYVRVCETQYQYPTNSLWNYACSGCAHEGAYNFTPNMRFEDGSCVFYPPIIQPLQVTSQPTIDEDGNPIHGIIYYHEGIPANIIDNISLLWTYSGQSNTSNNFGSDYFDTTTYELYRAENNASYITVWDNYQENLYTFEDNLVDLDANDFPTNSTKYSYYVKIVDNEYAYGFCDSTDCDINLESNIIGYVCVDNNSCTGGYCPCNPNWPSEFLQNVNWLGGAGSCNDCQYVEEYAVNLEVIKPTADITSPCDCGIDGIGTAECTSYGSLHCSYDSNESVYLSLDYSILPFTWSQTNSQIKINLYSTENITYPDDPIYSENSLISSEIKYLPSWTDGNDNFEGWYCPKPCPTNVNEDYFSVSNESYTNGGWCETTNTFGGNYDWPGLHSQPHKFDDQTLCDSACANDGKGYCTNTLRPCVNTEDCYDILSDTYLGTCDSVSCNSTYEIIYDYTKNIWDEIYYNGTYRLEVEYPANSGEIIGNPQYINVYVNNGCIDSNACTCGSNSIMFPNHVNFENQDCSSKCPHCGIEPIYENGQCVDGECMCYLPPDQNGYGFFNEYAVFDYCTPSGGICNDNNDCGFTGQSGSPLCNQSCTYPIPGCIDDGFIQPGQGYQNNQYGDGSVIPGIPALNNFVCKHTLGSYDPFIDDDDATIFGWNIDQLSCGVVNPSTGIAIADSNICVQHCQNGDYSSEECDNTTCESFATYQADSIQCQYYGCRTNGATNYFGNTDWFLDPLYFDIVGEWPNVGNQNGLAIWGIGLNPGNDDYDVDEWGDGFVGYGNPNYWIELPYYIPGACTYEFKFKLKYTFYADGNQLDGVSGYIPLDSNESEFSLIKPKSYVVPNGTPDSIGGPLRQYLELEVVGESGDGSDWDYVNIVGDSDPGFPIQQGVPTFETSFSPSDFTFNNNFGYTTMCSDNQTACTCYYPGIDCQDEENCLGLSGYCKPSSDVVDEPLQEAQEFCPIQDEITCESLELSLGGTCEWIQTADCNLVGNGTPTSPGTFEIVKGFCQFTSQECIPNANPQLVVDEYGEPLAQPQFSFYDCVYGVDSPSYNDGFIGQCSEIDCSDCQGYNDGTNCYSGAFPEYAPPEQKLTLSGETCVATKVRYDVPIYDSSDLTDFPIDYLVTITEPIQVDLEDPSNTKTKTLSINYTRNNYGPVLYPDTTRNQTIFGDSLNPTLDVNMQNTMDYYFVHEDIDGDSYIGQVEVIPLNNADLNAIEVTPISFDDTDNWVPDNEPEPIIPHLSLAANPGFGSGEYKINVLLYQPANPNLTYRMACALDTTIDCNQLGSSGDAYCKSPEYGTGNATDTCIWHYGPLYESTEISFNFIVSVIDTSGPSGYVVPSNITSFGISPDTWVFQAFGEDMREKLDYQIPPSTETPEQFTITAGFGYIEEMGICSNILDEGSTGNPVDCETGDNDCQNIANAMFDNGQLMEEVTSECVGNSLYDCIPIQETLELIDMGFLKSEGFEIYNELVTIEATTDYTPYDASRLFKSLIDDSEVYQDARWRSDVTCFTYDVENITNAYNEAQSAHQGLIGEQYIEDNPNFGGWKPQNTDVDPKDTVWRYEVQIRKESTYGSNDFHLNQNLIGTYDYRDWIGDWEGGEPLYLYDPPPNSIESIGNTSNVEQFLQQGKAFVFDKKGRYKAIVKAWDTHYSPIGQQTGTQSGSSEALIDVEYVIPIVQSVTHSYNPWQGNNIPSYQIRSDVENRISNFDILDLDPRPQLGCFYYDDDNSHGLTWDLITSGSYDEGPGTHIGNESGLGWSPQKQIVNKFIPDCDVRTPLSLLGTGASLYKYWDKDLHPEEYFETSAPAEVQFYFYPRKYPSKIDETHTVRVTYYNNYTYWHNYWIIIQDGQVVRSSWDSDFNNYPNGPNQWSVNDYGGNELTKDWDGIPYYNWDGDGGLPQAGYQDNTFEIVGDFEWVFYDFNGLGIPSDAYIKMYVDNQLEYEVIGRNAGTNGRWDYVNKEYTAPPDFGLSYYQGMDLVYRNKPVKSFLADDELEGSEWADCNDYRSSTFVGFIDWGDGSPLEYTTRPKVIGNDTTLKHTYERSGLYEVTGWMFRGEYTENCNISGVYDTFQKFTVRFWLNDNPEFENEFRVLGGGGYTYIPYQNSTPIIGGVSNYSLYAKTLKRSLGYVADDTEKPINVNFGNYKNRLDTEYALSLVDENYVGKEISKFTGSFGYEINTINGTLPDNIAIHSSSFGQDDLTEITHSLVRGFYSGSVDENGILDSTKPITLINKGDYQNRQELGNHLGDVNIGQTRFFLDGTITMAEMLGFDDSDVDVSNPGNERYWKNIIPSNYTALNRAGVEQDGNNLVVDEASSQVWKEDFYYPVLPKLNTAGKLDFDNLGLQTNGDGSERTPFGSLGISWDEDDTNAPITSPYVGGKTLLIDMDAGNLNVDSISDSSGNENLGIVFGDFKVQFDNDRIMEKKDNITTPNSNREDKSY